MSSLPSITIQPNNNSINRYPGYPGYGHPGYGHPGYGYPGYGYPGYSSTNISATAITPSTIFPISLVPTIASINPPLMYQYVNPLVPSIVSYPDVNGNRDLRKNITEYFFKKIIDNWLKYHYIELYQMLVVNGDKVVLIKDINQIESNNKSESKENNLKYQYLLVNYFAKSDIYRLLDKFRKINHINWWDLKNLSDDIRKFIQHKVTKYIKKQIIDQNSQTK
jgi:hypothetical protein